MCFDGRCERFWPDDGSCLDTITCCTCVPCIASVKYALLAGPVIFCSAIVTLIMSVFHSVRVCHQQTMVTCKRQDINWVVKGLVIFPLLILLSLLFVVDWVFFAVMSTLSLLYFTCEITSDDDEFIFGGCNELFEKYTEIWKDYYGGPRSLNKPKNHQSNDPELGEIKLVLSLPWLFGGIIIACLAMVFVMPMWIILTVLRYPNDLWSMIYEFHEVYTDMSTCVMVVLFPLYFVGISLVIIASFINLALSILHGVLCCLKTATVAWETRSIGVTLGYLTSLIYVYDAGHNQSCIIEDNMRHDVCKFRLCRCIDGAYPCCNPEQPTGCLNDQSLFYAKSIVIWSWSHMKPVENSRSTRYFRIYFRIFEKKSAKKVPEKVQ